MRSLSLQHSSLLYSWRLRSRDLTAPKRVTAVASVTALPEPLTDADLQEHIDNHGLKAALLPRPSDLPDSDVIKSLVFTANSQPVLVITGLASKVNERKLARHLGVSRRKVRLAPAGDALLHSGYAAGTVPPFGHRHPLRTLLDAGVTRHPGPCLWAGGGHPDIELRVGVEELLAHTQPEVGDFSTGADGSASGTASSLESADEEAASGGRAGAPEGGGATGALLPLPWPPGSDVVRLVGVVAVRRRIAKTLLFVTLIPEDVPALPRGDNASYLRRLWRHPDTGRPAGVQLIVGKTVERSLGRDAAIAAMDSIKVGSVISVTGRVQPHFRGARRAAAAADDAPVQSGASPGSPVLDVVVHSVGVLHKNGDALGVALHRAAREGGVAVGSAAELEQLRRLGPEHYAGAYLALGGTAGGGGGGSDTGGGNGGGGGGGGGGGRGGGQGARQLTNKAAGRGQSSGVGGGGGSGGEGDSEGGRAARRTAATDGAARAAAVGRVVLLPDVRSSNGSSSSSSTPTSTSIGTTTVSIDSSSSSSSSSGSGSAAPNSVGVDSAPQCWQLPLPMERVHNVCDLDGLQAVREAIFGSSTSNGTTRSTSNGSNITTSSGGGGGGLSSNENGGGGGGGCGGRGDEDSVPPVIVGLDVEWKPFDRGQPRTPAALLQLALRDRVFLLDLLALCRHPPAQPGGGPPAGGWPRGTPETEAALSSLIADLCSSPRVVKVGFYLKGDLERIRESYPWLPVFAPAAPGPAPALPAAAAGPGVEAEAEAAADGLVERGAGAAAAGGVRAGAAAAASAASPPASAAQATAALKAAAVATPPTAAAAAAASAGMALASPLSMHVDLLSLTRTVLPRMSSLSSISLTRLAELLLGAGLDKRQQRSDWGARPLGEGQRAYAAADALVLTAMFDELVRRSPVRVGARMLASLDGGLRCLPLSPPEEREHPPAGGRRG